MFDQAPIGAQTPFSLTPFYQMTQWHNKYLIDTAFRLKETHSPHR